VPAAQLTGGGDAGSPLRIIALFILLSQAAVSAAAIGTSGTTQFMLAVFAVAFPIVVLAVFVWLLLRHPGNLYAPSQYTAETNIEDFVSVLTRQQRASQVVLERAVSDAVVSGVVQKSPVEATVIAEDVRQHVADAFSQSVADSSVTVVRRNIRADASAATIPIDSDTTVQDLLDSIYYSLVPAVGPFTYNVEWVLALPNHDLLPDLGSAWADKQGQRHDERPIADVGIEPGMTLTVLPRAHRRFGRPR
jgi:hypothetical protein